MSYKPKAIIVGQRWEHEVHGKYRVIEHAGAFAGYGWFTLEHENNTHSYGVKDLELLKSSKYTYLGLPKPVEVEIGQIWKFSSKIDPEITSDWLILDLELASYEYAIVERVGEVEESGSVSITELLRDSHWTYLDSGQVTVVDYGDFCKKCNDYNNYVEKTGSYVCYGCKV